MGNFGAKLLKQKAEMASSYLTRNGPRTVSSPPWSRTPCKEWIMSPAGCKESMVHCTKERSPMEAKRRPRGQQTDTQSTEIGTSTRHEKKPQHGNSARRPGSKEQNQLHEMGKGTHRLHPTQKCRRPRAGESHGVGRRQRTIRRHHGGHGTNQAPT